MEAGVVAPETSVGIDGNYGGDNLRGEEKKDGDVEWSFGNLKFLVDERSDSPSRCDKNSYQIDKHHLVKLEYF